MDPEGSAWRVSREKYQELWKRWEALSEENLTLRMAPAPLDPSGQRHPGVGNLWVSRKLYDELERMWTGQRRTIEKYSQALHRLYDALEGVGLESGAQEGTDEKE